MQDRINHLMQVDVEPTWLDRAVLAALLLWCVAIASLGFSAVCQHLSSGAASQKQSILDKSAINDAKGSTSPDAHPLSSLNLMVKKLRAAALSLTIVFSVLVAGAIGLYFTPLSPISKIAVPVFGAVACLSFVNVIVLPFLPWLIGLAIVGAFALAVYEVYIYKGVKPAANALEAELGITSTSASGTLAGVTTAVENVLHIATPTGMK